MNTHKIFSYTRSVFIEYKKIFLAYAFLIGLTAILYPQQLFSIFATIRPLSIIATIISQPSIYMPLIIVVIFLLANLIWAKKFEITHRVKNVTIILIFTILSGILLNTIFSTANPSRVAIWSATFMKADLALFGTYPGFWLFHHMSPTLERIIVYVYTSLTSIISIWILFLFIYKNGTLANRFIQQFFMAFAICFPLWIFFASISPAQMYITNILHQPIPNDITQLVYQGPPTKFLDDNILKLIQQWTDPGGKNLAISTFPSMHTIWGILLAYSIAGAVQGKKYAYIAIILGIIVAIANMIGATYLLQHYAVDILAGIAVAVIITKIKFETK